MYKRKLRSKSWGENKVDITVYMSTTSEVHISRGTRTTTAADASLGADVGNLTD